MKLAIATLALLTVMLVGASAAPNGNGNGNGAKAICGAVHMYRNGKGCVDARLKDETGLFATMYQWTPTKQLAKPNW